MKKIKLFAAGACLLLAAGSLASCGEEEVVYEGVGTQINVWATAKEEAVIKNVVDAYNAKQTSETAKFNYKFTAVSEGDAGTTVSKDPTVDGAPALFLCADDHIYNLQSKNCISEMKGSYKTRVIENNTETALKGATYDDKLYGFPISSDNGYFLYYDKSALSDEEVGSLETILTKFKTDKKSMFMDLPNGYYAESFLMSPQACGLESLRWSAGADGKVAYTVNWDNEVGTKVNNYVGELIKTNYTDGTFMSGDDAALAKGLNGGTIKAFVSGTWMADTAKTAFGENCAATKLPEYHIDDKAYQMASFAGSKVYCLNKTRPVEEQKAAAALGDLLTSKEAQLERFKIRSTIPCNKEALADKEYSENVTYVGKALAAQSEFGAVQSQSAEGRYWDIGKAIGKAYTDGKFDETGTITTWADFIKGQCDILRKAQ